MTTVRAQPPNIPCRTGVHRMKVQDILGRVEDPQQVRMHLGHRVTRFGGSDLFSAGLRGTPWTSLAAVPRPMPGAHSPFVPALPAQPPDRNLASRVDVSGCAGSVAGGMPLGGDAGELVQPVPGFQIEDRS